MNGRTNQARNIHEDGKAHGQKTVVQQTKELGNRPSYATVASRSQINSAQRKSTVISPRITDASCPLPGSLETSYAEVASRSRHSDSAQRTSSAEPKGGLTQKPNASRHSLSRTSGPSAEKQVTIGPLSPSSPTHTCRVCQDYAFGGNVLRSGTPMQVYVSRCPRQGPVSVSQPLWESITGNRGN
ncbi:hypothetical protein FA95DRAFT_899567 [Auriscalpium vulgare]|uniref:Uncharacterized protein n=1 Tax=Auriscalpium vulgare TaxID=40419 RepID=A0ACB8R895_9AGAM|nr:hypothetical protein FA95DRAFT_899567 [Auriscalpium vulgare]